MSALPRNYIHRSGWKAAPPRDRPTILLASRVDAIVYHYTGADSDEQSDHANCARRVRGIQLFHQQVRGWNDIAYNYLTCKHGFIFEGRGIEHKSAATGAANSHTLAVCFLGDDSMNRDDVTAKGREALVEITRWIIQRRPAAQKRKGHRDFMATACPGNELYNYVTSKAFTLQISVDEKAKLRKQILAWHAAGWGWPRIKQTAVWRRFRELGGR